VSVRELRALTLTRYRSAFGLDGSRLRHYQATARAFPDVTPGFLEVDLIADISQLQGEARYVHASSSKAYSRTGFTARCNARPDQC
jgi:hypothetical protein